MAVTIKDVAKEAGVSPSTVSKVMNGWHTISEETAQRVRETMKRMEYVPNMRAASFARKATKNIAFLTALKKGEAFSNPHMFEIMCGTHEALAKKGYSLTLVDTSMDVRIGETAENIILKQGYDGMAVHGSAINPTVASLLIRKNFPHVVIGKPNFTSQICWLDTNNVLSGDTAARHLINSGCEKIAFIGGNEDEHISMYRLQGYKSVMYEQGLSVEDGYVKYTDSSIEQSYAAAKNLLDGGNAPDGIICENNMITFGVLKAIKEKQMKMPEDISLVAFDDFPYSRIMDPMPTVVNIDVFELGVQAGSMLIKKIKNPAFQIQSYTTLPELLKRSTTK